MVLEQMLTNLMNMDFFQLLFPFLLALAIFYSLLRWSLPKDRMPNSAIGLISIILSFFVMLYFSFNPTLYLWLTNVSGTLLIISSAILFLLILFAFMGLHIDKIKEWSWAQKAIGLVLLFIIVVVAFGASPWGVPGQLLDPTSELWTLFFFVIIVGIVLYYLGRDSGGNGGGDK